MHDKDLKKIISTLSTKEKVGQLIQLTGNFFDSSDDVIETGPMKRIGFHEGAYDLRNTGSLLNVVNPEKIYAIQKKYLETTTHNIPLLFMADVIYGYKTIFPIPLAQSGSWNFSLIEESARIIAKECYEAGIHVTFSPMVDIVRDPRWGRVMESPGEDTLLAEKYAKSMVKGIQGTDKKIPKEHIAACVKHFAAYGAPQSGLEYGAVELSYDSLQNYYLPSYKAAIDADVKLVMTAFNTLNGVPATGNKWLNKEVLRKEYDYNGVLISDYAAIEELRVHGCTETDKDSARMAFESSVDIDMKTSVYANYLPELAESNTAIMELLDEAVLRILNLKNDLGLFEDPYRGLRDSTKDSSILSDEHKQASQKLAEESVVLLKNDDVLPLESELNIAVIGPYAEEKSALGFWAITGDPKDTITLKSGMESLSDEFSWKVDVAKGANILEKEEIAKYGKYTESMYVDERSKEALLDEAIQLAKRSDKVVLALGESVYQSGEGGSRTEPTLPKEQIKLLKEIKKAGKPIILVIYAGRPLILNDIQDEVDAILYAWYPGTMGGYALANILSGKANPSGKLSMTFPRSVGQIPLFYNNYSSGRPKNENDPNHRFTSRYLDEETSALYPFGYGLSYTNFKYTGLSLDKDEFNNDEEIVASVKIKNTGHREGKEVVQLYIHDIAASVVRPVKELKDFKKVTLKPGEEKEVSFIIKKDLLTYRTQENGWQAEKGAFDVFVGSSSRDEKNKKRFYLID